MRREWFEGALADFAKTLVLDEARPVVPLAELVRGETLDRQLLKVYGSELMPDQQPVLVSQWMKYYAMQLIPPVMVANLVHGVSWPLAVDQLSFALHERGILDGVRFDGEPFDASNADDPFERFAPLLENLQQVIDRLSAYGGVAPSVLWGNAGDYLESCLRQLNPIHPAAGAVGYGLLREKTRPDGTRNPLFNAITYREGKDGQSIRQRRSCCLSHRVEWVGRCEHCPLAR
ncbi:ferric iron reductase protein FhuF [Pseudomonas sp. NFACC02]|uniref:siderophore-iron reductase FhuF n=1 Tax=Pseudomonas sp. NFACC02 TaxID=1566250 RepID=UPI0008D304D9|nr:siderophore-iron reductase FhuF [Pseudomonas sp. NFACC02]SER74791.1 ferric iron reductase protein FhuF [Pseudomonas sp. NFACC02]